MAESTYPKIKYQGVPDPEPKPWNPDKPGYIYQKVNSPEEEKALEGDWHDTPSEAMKASSGSSKPGAGGTHQSDPARRTEEWPTESEKARKK